MSRIENLLRPNGVRGLSIATEKPIGRPSTKPARNMIDTTKRGRQKGAHHRKGHK